MAYLYKTDGSAKLPMMNGVVDLYIMEPWLMHNCNQRAASMI